MSPDPALTDVRVRDIMPGIWEDGNGSVHFSQPEIFAHLGIPDLPEEREENLALIQQCLRDQGAIGKGSAVIIRRAQ